MARASLLLRIRQIFSRFPLLHQWGRTMDKACKGTLSVILRAYSRRSRFIGLPAGFFAGVDALRTGQSAGEIIWPQQESLEFPPDSLVKLSGLCQDGFQPWPVFWLKIEDSFLCGRSLVPKDGDGRLLAEATFSQTGDRTDPAFHYFGLGEGQVIRGNVTSIVSRWGGDARGNRRYGGAGYWHWLFDSVARLSLMDRFPSDTRVITPPLTPWMRWFLERLDLGERIIETEATALRVENFYFSSPSSMTGCWNPYAVDFLRSRFLHFGSPTSHSLPRKFYIMREGFTRRLSNEQEVRDFFISRGWALIAPEKLSVPDQIALFRDAEAIAGIHGSALTNLLWCSPGARVLEFVPENFMAGAFEWLARVNSVSHRFMLCSVNSKGEAVVSLKDPAILSFR